MNDAEVVIAGFAWSVVGAWRLLSCGRCEARWTLANGYGFALVNAIAVATAHDRRHHPTAGKR